MARRSTRPAAPKQTRNASTMPTRHTPPPPPPAQVPPPQTSSMAYPPPRQPGLFGQMASTAAGVAVGSAVGHTVGHGISSMFGGSSTQPEVTPEAQQQQQQQGYYGSATTPQSAISCEASAKTFTQCLEKSNNDMNSCQYYLEQLKACQAFAAQQH